LGHEDKYISVMIINKAKLYDREYVEKILIISMSIVIRDKHIGPGHSSPYPLSRLAPKFDLVNVQEEIESAGRMLNAVSAAKLEMLAKQIQMLQDEAYKIIYKAQEDMNLHTAECGFKKRPGGVYHLYGRENGSLYFSLVSPAEWEYRNPHIFIDSYLLNEDMSWTRVG